MSKTSSPADSIVSFINDFQSRTGATDDQMAAALGYESGRVVSMMKVGHMRLPINKVLQLAEAISVPAPRVLRAVLAEGAPDMLAVLDAVLPALTWDRDEAKLIETLRKLRADRKAVPVVFDGSAVVALLAV